MAPTLSRSSTLPSSVVSSTGATAGLVPTANGSGGYTWAPATAREDVRNAALGWKGQTFDPFTGGGVAVSLATQVAVFTLCGFNAGDVINNLIFYVPTAGVGATVPTSIFAGVFSQATVSGTTTLTQQAVSANVVAASYWLSTGYAVVPMGTPYTVPSQEALYLAILQNGTWSTALQVWHAALGGGAVKPMSASSPPVCIQETSQTSLAGPFTATTGSSTGFYWIAWS